MKALAAANGWPSYRLRDITSKLVDGSHNPPPKQDQGRPMLSARNVDHGRINFDEFRHISNESFEAEHARTRVAPGDVLLTIVGTIGRSAVVPEAAEPFALQRSVAVLSPKEDLLPKFLAYQFQSPRIQRYFEQNARGTAQKGVYLKTLGETPILVPPVSEQHAVVAELEKQFSRLDEAVANLKRVKANLKRYKAAVLVDAVEGDLAGDWTGWTAVRLGDVASSVRNGISIKPAGESGTRILRISAVRPMALDLSDVRYLAQPLDEFQAFRLTAGDVLFTRYNGSVDLVAVCAAVAELPEPTVYPDKLIRVQVPSEFLLPSFLVIAASTGKARAFIRSRIRTTAGQAGVSGGDIKGIPLRVPPLAEQRRIVAEVDRRLSVVRELEAALDANFLRGDALRRTTLANSFALSN